MKIEHSGATGCLVLADGTVIRGKGFGAEGTAVGELCFNTAMTGYQEIMTDPSYAEQIVMFTFPHIGNVGVNPEDEEAAKPVAAGMVVREMPTRPSSWRSTEPLDAWLARTGRIGIAGIDTRRLTRKIRTLGMPHVALCHDQKGCMDSKALEVAAQNFAGLQGADLAAKVTCEKETAWTDGGRWQWSRGFARPKGTGRRVVVFDYGAKRNIFRCLASLGCEAVLLPAGSSAADILAARPDGVLLSNGPGDPAATAVYAAGAIREVLDEKIPVFGICLGHQILALALGAETLKMPHGHHGANHPVRDLASGQVSVVSMNHGFTVNRETLPGDVSETHVSLFDGTNCGIRSEKHVAFSVQFHPEASPGPQDNFGLFNVFLESMGKNSRVGTDA